MVTRSIQEMAKLLRFEAVRMIYEGGDGHPGPALSIAEIVATLFFKGMNVDPNKPDWEDRDRFILSKGHSCPIYYAALNEKGYFEPKVDHFHLRELGSIFQGHPVMRKTPGIDMTSGSLGNGIAIGAGMAIAGKIKNKNYYVYVITGDGELQEGVSWEGVNTASGNKLDHLIVFVDRNGWQSCGCCDDIIGNNNIADRFRAFNWHTQEINGHDTNAIEAAIENAKAAKGLPSAIICDCIKGKGLDYMENNNDWHKGVPTKEQFEIAVKLLGGEK